MKLVFTLLTLSLATFLYSCEKETPPQEMLNDLVKKERVDRIGIGRVDEQTKKLELIVFGVKPELRELTISSADILKIREEHEDENRPANMPEGTDAQLSPDGRWITYRTRDNKFVLADSTGKIERTLFGGKEIVTPLHWSLDAEYLLYVERTGAWEFGECGKYLTDGWDLMVYRVRDGQKGLIYQVCEGYPVGGFGWIRIPVGLPLS